VGGEVVQACGLDESVFDPQVQGFVAVHCKGPTPAFVGAQNAQLDPYAQAWG
jgi:hypothetical protein